jgi:hypothetical protein
MKKHQIINVDGVANNKQEKLYWNGVEVQT